MNVGRYVFSQVVKYIPRYQFDKCVEKYRGDWHVKDYRIYEEFGICMISLVRPLYAKVSIPDVTIDNVLYALDSTTISTSIKLATWAWGKYSRGGGENARKKRRPSFPMTAAFGGS